MNNSHRLFINFPNYFYVNNVFYKYIIYLIYKYNIFINNKVLNIQYCIYFLEILAQDIKHLRLIYNILEFKL